MKSQVRTIEACISCIILVGFAAWLSTSLIDYPSFKELQIKYQTMIALQELKKSGKLREVAYRNDSLTIKSYLSRFLPKVYQYEVVFCYEDGCTTVNVTGAKEIYTVSYFLSHNFTDPKNLEVVVYVVER